MMDERVIELHQSQLKFHRILYGVLIICVCIFFCWDMSQVPRGYFVLIGGTVVVCLLETLLSKLSFMNRTYVLRFFTLLQYVFYFVMMYCLHDKNAFLLIGISALVLTFMFEYSYYNEISDVFGNFRSFFVLVMPAIVCVVIFFCRYGVNIDAFLMVAAYVMLCLFDILVVRLCYISEHKYMNDIHVLLTQIDAIEDNNEELTQVKNRVEKVNEELNLQRVQLAQANREIQQNNSELEVQAEILKFINSSFAMDISYVMEYIIDAVIRVRKVEFCGIYIDKDVCYNKKPISVCKCQSKPECKECTELLFLFQQATGSEEDHQIIKEFPKERFPNLSQTKVCSMLVLPLVLNGEKYGIMVSGSSKYQVFDTYVRFYDLIVPQFDLAVHNVKMYAQMRHIAQTDGLTGINNRTHFNKLFAEQMERTVKEKGALTVALFDIDKFKRINDTYGHLVGDEVIKAIAHMAYQLIEEAELGFVCRYGGEEFVLALPNLNIEQSIPIIQKLHEEIASTTVEAYGHVVTMNVSIGVSSYPELCDDVNQLIKRADWSMYYAKEHGRGQIKIDGPDIQEG